MQIVSFAIVLMTSLQVLAAYKALDQDFDNL